MHLLISILSWNSFLWCQGDDDWHWIPSPKLRSVAPPWNECISLWDPGPPSGRLVDPFSHLSRRKVALLLLLYRFDSCVKKKGTKELGAEEWGWWWLFFWLEGLPVIYWKKVNLVTWTWSLLYSVPKWFIRFYSGGMTKRGWPWKADFFGQFLFNHDNGHVASF